MKYIAFLKKCLTEGGAKKEGQDALFNPDTRNWSEAHLGEDWDKYCNWLFVNQYLKKKNLIDIECVSREHLASMSAQRWTKALPLASFEEVGYEWPSIVT